MKKKINLQLFADDAATGTDTAGKAEGGNAETNSKETPAEKKESEKKYTDDDVNKILDKKFAEWQQKKQKEVDEAAKLAKMDATQRAEHERDELKKELDALKKKDSLAEMTKTARKMLADNNINIPDELLSMMVNTNAEETKAAVDGFAKVFKEAVEAAVKERLKGEPPKKGSTNGTTAMTKEQILAVKDHEERQKLMLENKHLFNL